MIILQEKTKKTAKGFTLIETVIYIALLGMLMSGTVVGAYQIFESTGRDRTKTMLQEEGDFLIAKVAWALSGAETMHSPVITAPPCSATSTSLSLTKRDSSVGLLSFSHSGTNIFITQKEEPPALLNNANIEIISLSFKRCSNGGINPESVETSIILGARTPNGSIVSRTFSSVNYLQR